MRAAFATLIIASAGLGFFRIALFMGRYHGGQRDVRLSGILACIAFGGFVVLATEVASALGCLNQGFALGVWILTALALHGFAEIALRGKPDQGPGWREDIHACFEKWRQSPADIRWMTGFTVVWVGVLGLLALSIFPSNQDALGYHLPRVMHWLQQASVSHFPTDNTRQVEFGPWAGYIQAHLFLLSGGDRLANLPQWFAMLSSCLMVSWIAGQFYAAFRAATPGRSADDGVSARRCEVFAALLMATLPIGIVECITPQNDFLTAMWALASLAMLLAWKSKPRATLYALGFGVALGLGVLTKSSMYFYAAPVVIAAAVWLIRRGPLSGMVIGQAVLVLLSFVALNSAHGWRNASVFGSPFGSQPMLESLRNTPITAKVVASNVIRNLALHTQSGIEPLARALNAPLSKLHELTGQDLEEAGSTYAGSKFSWNPELVVYDSQASCFWHLLLLAVLVIFMSVSHARITAAWALLFGAGFFMFCIMLRWQEWNSRIHLGFMALAIPAMAVGASCLPRKLLSLAAIILAGFACLCLSINQSVPPWHSEYWLMSWEEKSLSTAAPLKSAAQALAALGPARVGMKFLSGEEYRLWLALRQNGFSGSLENVLVENATARLATETNPPQSLITMAPERLPASFAQLYVQVMHSQAATLLVLKTNRPTHEPQAP